MTTTKGVLIVVLLIGWMVSTGGADALREGAAEVRAEGAVNSSPFAGGLPESKDPVQSDSADREAEAVKQENSKQPAAGKANEGASSRMTWRQRLARNR
ncbi:hypothetical protein NKDENANG_04103 [Candidatus Entotheonellaceae bacterium PAL068K]